MLLLKTIKTNYLLNYKCSNWQKSPEKEKKKSLNQGSYIFIPNLAIKSKLTIEQHLIKC